MQGFIFFHSVHLLLPKHWNPLFPEFFTLDKNTFQWLAALASTKRELFCQIDVDFNVDIDVDVWEFHIFNKIHSMASTASAGGTLWFGLAQYLPNTRKHHLKIIFSDTLIVFVVEIFHWLELPQRFLKIFCQTLWYFLWIFFTLEVEIFFVRDFDIF